VRETRILNILFYFFVFVGSVISIGNFKIKDIDILNLIENCKFVKANVDVFFKMISVAEFASL
jgi:hypothetical protein